MGKNIQVFVNGKTLLEKLFIERNGKTDYAMGYGLKMLNIFKRKQEFR